MIKQIEINGYNTVEIRKRYANGDCLCDVQFIETDRDGNEKVVKSDTDLIFTSEQLQLTPDDILELNPIQDVPNTNDII